MTKAHSRKERLREGFRKWDEWIDSREQAWGHKQKDQKWWKDDEKNGRKAARVEVFLNALRFIKVIIGGT